MKRNKKRAVHEIQWSAFLRKLECTAFITSGLTGIFRFSLQAILARHRSRCIVINNSMFFFLWHTFRTALSELQSTVLWYYSQQWIYNSLPFFFVVVSYFGFCLSLCLWRGLSVSAVCLPFSGVFQCKNIELNMKYWLISKCQMNRLYESFYDAFGGVVGLHSNGSNASCHLCDVLSNPLRKCLWPNEIQSRCVPTAISITFYFMFMLRPSRQSHFHIYVKHSILIYLYVVYLNLKYAIAMRIGIIVAVILCRFFSFLNCCPCVCLYSRIQRW